MYALPIILISAWSKHLNVFEKGYYTADYDITWTPSNDLHKLSDTQSISMYHSVVKIVGLSFSKLSFKVASAYMLPQSSGICLQKVVIC